MSLLGMMGASLLTDAATKFLDRPKQLRNKARQTKINQLNNSMQTENMNDSLNNAKVMLNNKDREYKISKLENSME